MNFKELKVAYCELHKELGKPPTVQKLAAKVGSTYREVNTFIQKNGEGYKAFKIAIEEEEGLPSTVADSLAKQEQELIRSTIVSSVHDGRDWDGYVVTAAQNATDLFMPFWRNMVAYAEMMNFKIIVIAQTYRNNTGTVAPQYHPLEYWVDDIPKSGDLIKEDQVLYEGRSGLPGVRVFGALRSRPTAVNPLNGLQANLDGYHSIVGHPRIKGQSYAQSGHPIWVQTTGYCTKKNYVMAQQGYKAEAHHTYGFTVVEAADNSHGFNIRRVTASSEDGSFQDLDCLWKDGAMAICNPEAMVLGDTHFPNHDKEAIEWCIEAAEEYYVSTLVWHDLLDFYCQNHHNRGDILHRVKVAHRELSVEDELYGLIGWMGDNFSEYRNLIVESNHDAALDRWLKETDPRSDAVNIGIWCDLMRVLVEDAKSDIERSALQVYLDKTLMLEFGYEFIGPSRECVIGGTHLERHGHVGLKGSRGSAKQLSKVYKAAIGHSHDPCEEDGITQGGVTCKIPLGYAANSPNAWWHTYILVAPSGKRQLILRF